LGDAAPLNVISANWNGKLSKVRISRGNATYITYEGKLQRHKLIRER